MKFFIKYSDVNKWLLCNFPRSVAGIIKYYGNCSGDQKMFKCLILSKKLSWRKSTDKSLMVGKMDINYRQM